MPTQEARSQQTQSRLIRVARQRFVAYGFHATLLDQILRDAGLSKGALYHHFASKEELLVAVFEQVAAEAVAKARAADPQGPSHLARLITISLAWLEAVKEHDARVIILETAPRVIGWQQTRVIQERTAIGLVRGTIRAAIAAQEANCAHIHVAARLIGASLTELALMGHEGGAAALSPSERHRLVENLILHLAGASLGACAVPGDTGAPAKASP